MKSDIEEYLILKSTIFKVDVVKHFFIFLQLLTITRQRCYLLNKKRIILKFKNRK